MKIYKFNIVLLLFIFLNSCYDDQSKYADQGYNAITIEKLASDTIRAFLGDTIYINPVVSSTEDTEIEYSWEMGLYSRTISNGDTTITTVFTQIADTKDLAYAHSTLGEYRLRFIATNEDGSTAKLYTFFVEAEYEEGFVILCKDENDQYDITFKPMEAGVDLGDEFKPYAYATANDGALLEGKIAKMREAGDYIYILHEDAKKITRIAGKSFSLYAEYDLSSLDPDFIPLDLFVANSNASYVYVPNANGGVASVYLGYNDIFDNSTFDTETKFVGSRHRYDPWSSYWYYLLDDENNFYNAYGTKASICSGKELINYFMFDSYWNSIGFIYKDGEDYKFNGIVQTFYTTDDEIRDTEYTGEVLLTENTENLSSDATFWANDEYSVVFYNKDNKLFKWAYNQNALPSEPFVTLGENEVITFIEGFPWAYSGTAPVNDFSEVHVYTNNTTRSGYTGSMYRINCLTGEIITAHEGVMNCPVQAFYKCK